MVRLPSPQRVASIFLLAVMLIAPAATGAQPGPHDEDRRTGFVATLTSELCAQWWSFLSSLWEKEGCGLDPHGACKAGSSDANSQEGKNGCIIDPNGGCKPETEGSEDPAQTKEGCIIDPHGGCRH